MRFPRLRFTVRRMMFAVAIMALLLGTFVWIDTMIRRSAEFMAKANKFKAVQKIRMDQLGLSKSMEKMHESMLAMYRVVPPYDRGRIEETLKTLEKEKNMAEGYRKKAEYWSSQHEKYLQASKRAWLPVAPDLPEPE